VQMGMKGRGTIERHGYEDVVRTASGWRIQSRTHVRDGPGTTRCCRRQISMTQSGGYLARLGWDGPREPTWPRWVRPARAHDEGALREPGCFPGAASASISTASTPSS
jgi:hypothetical protein